MRILGLEANPPAASKGVCHQARFNCGVWLSLLFLVRPLPRAPILSYPCHESCLCLKGTMVLSPVPLVAARVRLLPDGK